MKILDALRRGTSPRSEPGAQDEHASRTEHALPFPGYDGLSSEDLAVRLPELSQADLGAIDAYERENRNRDTVLDKLRYMRTTEPLPGYDAMDPEQIGDALAAADATTVKAVRDYEKKFRNRHEVIETAVRALPTAQAGAGADRALEEREARVREGFASRAQTPTDRSD